MSDENRPNDHTPPTYFVCVSCECGFNERPIGACPACKVPIEPQPAEPPVKGKK